jgi:hypothetical protein
MDPIPPAGIPAHPDPLGRALRNKRWNERIKLFAASVDRMSTLTIAGGILTPVFQNQPMQPRSVIG